MAADRLASCTFDASMRLALGARHYSPATKKAYIAQVRAYCAFILPKTPETCGPEEVLAFIADREQDGAAASSLNQAISALLFFYRNTLGRAMDIPWRPRKDKRLPRAMAIGDIERLLKYTPNLKHRLMFSLAYGSGLRVSEIATLRISDLDLTSRTIFVHMGKGRKDRLTILSDTCALLTRKYLAHYAPQKWLFEGQGNTGHIDIRSVQAVFAQGKARSGIKMEGGIHSLRHSFATSLIAGGTPLPYVQALLGHASIATTAVYTHLSTSGALATVSPIDRL